MRWITHLVADGFKIVAARLAFGIALAVHFVLAALRHWHLFLLNRWVAHGSCEGKGAI